MGAEQNLGDRVEPDADHVHSCILEGLETTPVQSRGRHQNRKRGVHLRPYPLGDLHSVGKGPSVGDHGDAESGELVFIASHPVDQLIRLDERPFHSDEGFVLVVTGAGSGQTAMSIAAAAVAR